MHLNVPFTTKFASSLCTELVQLFKIFKLDGNVKSDAEKKKKTLKEFEGNK